jgi:photosynthetic reaction center H subunit
MGTGAITDYIDVAQLVLYLFWIFFAGLVIYLTLESKREGFPLETPQPDGSIRYDSGLLHIPEPKVYKTAFHGEFLAPHGRDLEAPAVKGESLNGMPGSPLEPIGDPMTADLGPGAYTQRMDVTDKTRDGHDKIVPLRIATGFSLAHQDTNPIGLAVLGADQQTAGQVTDVWVDRSEHMIRYLEVQTVGGRTVLLPMNFLTIHHRRFEPSWIRVEAIMANQFEGVPATASPQSVTLLEEEKITAYFGAGTLFADPRRRDPLA